MTAMDDWAQVRLLSRLGLTCWMPGDSTARLIEHEFTRVRAENERLRAALMLIEEVTTRPDLSDKDARGGAWSLAAAALDRRSGGAGGGAD